MITKITLATALTWLIAISAFAQPTPPAPPSPPKGKVKKMIIIRNGDSTIVQGDDLVIDMDDLQNGVPEKFRKQLKGFNPNDMMRQPGSINENKALLGVLTEKNEKGAIIKEIMKGTPAEKAGLKADDIITAINGVAINSAEELTQEVGKYMPDTKINITYLRNQQTENTTAILATNNRASTRNYQFIDTMVFNMDDMFKMLPPERKEWAPKPRKLQLGVGIQDMESSKGVKITSVTENSPAALAGIKKDDVILSVNGTSLTDINDLRRILNETKEGDKWKVDYERGNKKTSTEVVFPKKLKTAEL
ncbi:MAG: PDZ domain-containing protein [Chitinophagia bacterium]